MAASFRFGNAPDRRLGDGTGQQRVMRLGEGPELTLEEFRNLGREKRGESSKVRAGPAVRAGGRAGSLRPRRCQEVFRADASGIADGIASGRALVRRPAPLVLGNDIAVGCGHRVLRLQLCQQCLRRCRVRSDFVAIKGRPARRDASPLDQVADDGSAWT